MMFTFGEGDLARGCIDMQLLIWSGVELMAGCQMPSMRISRRSASERVKFRPFTRATVRRAVHARARRRAVAVIGQGRNSRDGRSQSSDGLQRRSDRRRRGGGAVSVRCVLHWKRGLSPQ